MLIVLSPAKNLDYETPLPTKRRSTPEYLGDAEALMEQLRTLAPQDVSALMGISDKLGLLNYDRYQQWSLPFTPKNARPAVLAFNGDVYSGLQAYEFSADDFAFAQDHLRILSGLYGLLRPLDLMQAYRLEMGTKFENSRGKDLYQFWGELLTEGLNKQLNKLKSNELVNLASQEYFKSVQPKALDGKVITPVFKDWKNGQYRVISFFAKKARGMMAAFAIRNRLESADQLKTFSDGGYGFDETLSTDTQWVFTRRES